MEGIEALQDISTIPNTRTGPITDATTTISTKGAVLTTPTDSDGNTMPAGRDYSSLLYTVNKSNPICNKRVASNTVCQVYTKILGIV